MFVRVSNSAGCGGRRAETPELIAESIAAPSWLAPEQTLITSTCGMNHLPRQIAFGKLQAMARAKLMLGGVTGA